MSKIDYFYLYVFSVAMAIILSWILTYYLNKGAISAKTLRWLIISVTATTVIPLGFAAGWPFSIGVTLFFVMLTKHVYSD